MASETFGLKFAADVSQALGAFKQLGQAQNKFVGELEGGTSKFAEMLKGVANIATKLGTWAFLIKSAIDLGRELYDLFTNSTEELKKQEEIEKERLRIQKERFKNLVAEQEYLLYLEDARREGEEKAALDAFERKREAVRAGLVPGEVEFTPLDVAAALAKDKAAAQRHEAKRQEELAKIKDFMMERFRAELDVEGAGEPTPPGPLEVFRSKMEKLQQREVPKMTEERTRELDLMKDSFSAFSSSVAAGFDALITGQGNFLKAITTGIAQNLRALAVQYSVKALGAMAEGYFYASVPGGQNAATAAFAAAKFYGAAAAAAGVGAAAVGGMSGAFGGGGSSPSFGGAGGGAGGGFVQRLPGGSGGGNQTIIVQVGDGFVGRDTELAAEIDKAVRKGQRSGHVRTESAVTFS